MTRRSHRPEQIIKKLREAEVLLSQGSIVGEAARKIGVTEQTYYRWRREYGGMKIEQVKRLKELEKENTRLKRLVADLSLDNAILKEADEAKLLSPSKRRKMVDTVLKTLKVLKRRACRVLGQARTTQRHSSHIRNDEERLVARIIELRARYGRYGYRRITALLNQEGWKVNHKRVERIWRKEGLKLPKK